MREINWSHLANRAEKMLLRCSSIYADGKDCSEREQEMPLNILENEE